MRDLESISIPSFPEKVMVQTHSFCNCACIFCPYDSLKSTMPQGRMEWDLYKKIIDECSKHDEVERILPYLMNEPLLDKEIVKKIDYAKEKNPNASVHILTNGLLLDKKKSEKLISSKLDWIGISFHGLTKERYEQIMKGLSYEEVLYNVECFAKLASEKRGEDFTLLTTIKYDPINPETETDVREFWSQLGIKRISYFGAPISRAGNVEVVDVPQKEKIRGCKSIWTMEMVHILFNGDVVLCCMDWGREVVLGNVKERSIEEIWNSERYWDVRKKIFGEIESGDDYLCKRCEESVSPTEICGEVSEMEKAAVKNNPKRKREVDILLASTPPWGVENPPVGLATLTTYLKGKGLNVEVFDFNIKLYRRIEDEFSNLWHVENKNYWSNPMTFKILMQVFKSHLDWAVEKILEIDTDVIGFSVVDPKERITIEMIREIKRRESEKIIILGGPATFTKSTRKIFLDEVADLIDGFVIGEGEETLNEVVQKVKDSQPLLDIPGFLSVVNGEPQSFNLRPRIMDLDIVPFPTFDEFDFKEYTSSELIVDWSRGCIGNCAFCKGKILDGPYRRRSAKNIFDALKYYVENFDISNFTVCDSILNGDIKNLGDLCDLIIEKGLKISWRGEGIPRPEMSYEILNKMNKAGCTELQLGVESGSDKILESIGKLRLFTVDDAERVIKDTFRAGIRTSLFIIVGFPGEDDEEFEKTVDFIKRNRNFIYQIKSVNSLHIISETPLYNNAKEFGIILPDKDEHYLWRTEDGRNTIEVRNQRIWKLLELAKELGIEVLESNVKEGKHYKIKEVRKEKSDTKVLRRLKEDVNKIQRYDERLKGAPEAPVKKDFETSVYYYKKKILNIKKNKDREDIIILDFPHLRQKEIVEELEPMYFQSLLESKGKNPLILKFEEGFSEEVKNGKERDGVEALKEKIDLEYYLDEILSLRCERVLIPVTSTVFYAIYDLVNEINSRDGSKRITYWLGEDLMNEQVDMLPFKETDSLVVRDKIIDLQGYFPLFIEDDCTEEEIIDRVRSLLNKGKNRLFLYDPIFMRDLDFVKSLFSRLKDEGLYFKWLGKLPIKPYIIDSGLLELLKSTGCEKIVYEVDYLSNTLLEKMGRWYKRADVKNLLELSNKNGIENLICIVVGSPDEGERELKEIVSFIKANRDMIYKIEDLSVPFVTNDSPLGKDCERFGIYFPKDYFRSRWHNGAENNLSFRVKKLKEFGLVVLKENISFDHEFIKKDPYFFKNKESICQRLEEKFAPDEKFISENKDIKGVLNKQRAFRGPEVIELDITSRCMNSCIGCWCHSPLILEEEEKSSNKVKELPFDVVKSVIEDAVKMRTKKIQISGSGEPLLHPRLVDIVELIRKNDLECEIITGLVPPTGEKLKRLVELKLDLLTVSVWAGTEKGYVKTHPNQTEDIFFNLKDRLKEIYNWKKELGQIEPIVKVYNVILNKNYDEVEEMISFAQEVCADFIEFQVIDIIPGLTDSLALDDDCREELVRSFKKIIKRTSFPGAKRSIPIQIYEKSGDRTEFIDFGWVLRKSLPEDFIFNDEEAVTLVCPMENKGWRNKFDPRTNSFRFDFKEFNCGECKMFDSCGIDKDTLTTDVEFTALKGFGSFYRRISSKDRDKGEYERSIIDSIPCYVGWIYSRVRSNGDVIPCCKGVEYPMGNVLEASFEKIWHSKKMNVFRKNAVDLPKSHPYFSRMLCYKSCDNVGMNLKLHERIRNLTKEERGMLSREVERCNK